MFPDFYSFLIFWGESKLNECNSVLVLIRGDRGKQTPGYPELGLDILICHFDVAFASAKCKGACAEFYKASPLSKSAKYCGGIVVLINAVFCTEPISKL